jgi:EAL domain-containing protein (putative c-di-GMP-specific phosphodiesterase class I)
VTESVFIIDGARARIVLNDLKRVGVQIALDDFGTGYSSLSYLKHFPVDIVKIDRSFISDLGYDRTSRYIVRAVTGLAHDLGMTVIAEGVETVGQFNEVVDLDCDYYQGFYFARPSSPAALAPVLTRGYDDRHGVGPGAPS